MPRASRSSLAEALDFVSDWGVLAFASWTLIAYVGMATEARVSVLVSVWLATVPLLGAIRAVLARRSSGNPTPEPPAEPRTTPLPVAPAPGYRRHLWIAGLGAGVASALIAAASQKAPWLLVWAGTLAAVAVAVGFGRLRVGETACPRPTFGWRAHAFVATVGLGFAIMSLFLRRENLDDAFYVNRATGTSQLNRIPVRDIIFTDEKVPALSGTGLPVDSFSALQGAIGRFIDVHPASVAYYVTPPLFTFLATWALWRLLRLWAPRNAVLCFALGCTYWVFSAQGGMSAGSFFLNRMWQGKVIFVAWLVLTTYVFLTRWLERRDAVTAVLLLAAGVCSIGMTASAAFVVPLLMGAAVLPLLACRDWRGLPVVIAAAGIPFVIGLVVTLEHPLVKPLNLGHERAHLYDHTSWYFHEVFGIGLVAAVGLIGSVGGAVARSVGPTCTPDDRGRSRHDSRADPCFASDRQRRDRAIDRSSPDDVDRALPRPGRAHRRRSCSAASRPLRSGAHAPEPRSRRLTRATRRGSARCIRPPVVGLIPRRGIPLGEASHLEDRPRAAQNCPCDPSTL